MPGEWISRGRKPKHQCDLPTRANIGAIWRCECGKRWRCWSHWSMRAQNHILHDPQWHRYLMPWNR
jgi:hypothetical protein